jgi:adenylate cyclase
MLAGKLIVKSSVFKSHSFYFRIVTSLIGLLIITVIPILYNNFRDNKRIVIELTEDLTDQIVKTVIEKTSNYFLPASITVEMSSRLSEIGAITCTDDNKIELYTLGVLKAYSQISMFYLADEYGNYIRSWNLPDGTMESRVIKPSGIQPTDTFKIWDADFKVLRTHQATIVDYDPRIRPWYAGARETQGNYWTDLYVLFRNKKPAITSAHPFYDPNGNIQGVWAMDIELDEISGFLKNLKVGKNGIVFIINGKDQVVAYPDASRIIKEENGALRPVTIEELGNLPVTEAYRKHMRTGESKSVVEIAGRRYFASFSEFPKTFPVPWQVVLIVPEDDFTGNVKEMITETLFLCIGILVVAIFFAIFIARAITRPIQLLAEETKQIKSFNLDEKVVIRSRVKEIQLMSNAISAMKTGLQAFRRYAPAELVRQLVHTGEEARLGGHKRELTVLFSDISGFTTIAERIPAEELMIHLSDYFDELTKILSDQLGTVDKYIGDGIMAFWGAPVPDEDHVFHACNAGLLCQEKLVELNRKWESEGRVVLDTRIGISSGETVVGNVGSSERMDYTVIGDNVNLASRLESVNKLYKTKIAVSQKTYLSVCDRFWFRPLGIIAVKGKTEGIRIYELVGRRGEGALDEVAELCTEFERGFNAYLAREWDLGYKIFENLAMRFPGDAPAVLYMARCRHYRETPPGEAWKGIEYLEFK